MLPPYVAIIRHPLGGRSRVFYWNVAQKTKYRQKWKRKAERSAVFEVDATAASRKKAVEKNCLSAAASLPVKK
ncbi:hypothetical protein [Faecalibacterium sp.]|uniref:hypothetical protein n=1 Tax=Faecalibacterium sp. TaxID=1971605 RepID=UPI00399604AE